MIKQFFQKVMKKTTHKFSGKLHFLSGNVYFSCKFPVGNLKIFWIFEPCALSFCCMYFFYKNISNENFRGSYQEIMGFREKSGDKFWIGKIQEIMQKISQIWILRANAAVCMLCHIASVDIDWNISGTEISKTMEKIYTLKK